MPRSPPDRNSHGSPPAISNLWCPARGRRLATPQGGEVSSTPLQLLMWLWAGALVPLTPPSSSANGPGSLHWQVPRDPSLTPGLVGLGGINTFLGGPGALGGPNACCCLSQGPHGRGFWSLWAPRAHVSLRGGPAPAPPPPPEPGSRAGQIQARQATAGSRSRCARGLRIPGSRAAGRARPWCRGFQSGTNSRSPQTFGCGQSVAHQGAGRSTVRSRWLTGRHRTRPPPTSHRAGRRSLRPPCLRTAPPCGRSARAGPP